MKKCTAVPPLALMCVCFLVMAFLPVPAVAVVSCALMGAAWGIFYSYFYTETTVVVTEEKQGTALCAINAVNGMAMVVGTYGVTALQVKMGAASIVSVFPILGAICLVTALYSVYLVVKAKKA